MIISIHDPSTSNDVVFDTSMVSSMTLRNNRLWIVLLGDNHDYLVADQPLAEQIFQAFKLMQGSIPLSLEGPWNWQSYE